VVPPNRQAWHARSYNATHLGIEFVKRDPSVYTDVLTDEQYRTAAWWLRGQSERWGFPLTHETLPEHRDIQGDKIDIGSGFDRSRLEWWINRFAQ